MEGFIVLWIVCGIVAAIIGSRKGAGCSAFIVGLALGPIGIVVAIIMKGDRRQCPSCQEYIDKNATRCPKCQVDLEKRDAPVSISCEPSIENETKKCPECAEQIKFEAIKCRFCGHYFDPAVVEAQSKEWGRNLETKIQGYYESQEGMQGEAFCIGCRTTGPRSQMLYNKKLYSFYHKGCIPKATGPSSDTPELNAYHQDKVEMFEDGLIKCPKCFKLNAKTNEVCARCSYSIKAVVKNNENILETNLSSPVYGTHSTFQKTLTGPFIKLVPFILKFIGVFIGVLFIIAFCSNHKSPQQESANQKETTTPSATAPTSNEADDSIRESLRNSFFGDYTNAKIINSKGEANLEVWRPHIEYSKALSPAMRDVMLEGVESLQAEYDEIWEIEISQSDRQRLYWKNKKIQASTLEKYYLGDPSTGATLSSPSFKIENIYNQEFILNKLREK